MPDTHFDPDSSPVTGDEGTMQPVQQQSPRRIPSRKIFIAGLVLLILLVGGITAAVYWTDDKKSVDNSTQQTTEIANIYIYITAEGFVPANLQIKPNTQVVWTNKDTVSHEVSLKDSNAKPLDISEQLAPGESFSIVLDEEKDYYVHSPAEGSKYQGVIKVKSKANGDE